MQWLSVMALNLGFREFIGIMERDGRLDIYFWSLTRTHIGLIRTCTSWNIHGLAQKILLRRRLSSHKMPSNEGMRI